MSDKTYGAIVEKVMAMSPLTPGENLKWNLIVLHQRMGDLRQAAVTAAGEPDFKRWPAWPTGRVLAVAIILNRCDVLTELKYTVLEAIDRIGPHCAEWLPTVAAELRRDGLI